MPNFTHLKVLPFKLEKAEQVTGTGRPRLHISGWASTDTLDLDKEVIEVGFFDESLEDFMRTAAMPWMHDTGDPQGQWADITPVPGKGYYVIGDVIDFGTDLDKRRLAMIEERVIGSLSVGFAAEYTAEYGREDESGIWHWERGGKLLEVSLCTIPCNPDASFEMAKSLGMTLPHYEPSPAQTPEEAEEARFADDLERVRTGLESASNIHCHWQEKHGRTLTAAHRERIAQAQASLALLLEPHPVADEEPEPQGALSLPKVPALTLPQVALPQAPTVPLPGG